MKKENPNLSKFESYLRLNTNLSESSLRLYIRTIKLFVSKYNDVSMDSVNEFICSHNAYYVKYVFKHYLASLNKLQMYYKLAPVKVPVPIKQVSIIPEGQLMKIILNISKSLYMDIALLQYATAARVKEILTIKEENVNLDFDKECIRISLQSTHGERPLYLSADFKTILSKYIKGMPGYLFLEANPLYMDKDEIERMITTKCTYYYNELRKSAKSLGINSFSGADLRRNVIENIKKDSDIQLVQKVLGHANIQTTLRYYDTQKTGDVKKAMLNMQNKIMG